MASKVKVDQLETLDGTGTIALQNQLSGMTGVSMPSGHILQMVQTQIATTTSTSSLLSFVDTSSLLAITPSATSSKILVIFAV